MTLGSTQPLTQKRISWVVKETGAYVGEPYHLNISIFLKSGVLDLLDPSGPVQACNGMAFTLKIETPYDYLANCISSEESARLRILVLLASVPLAVSLPVERYWFSPHRFCIATNRIPVARCDLLPREWTVNRTDRDI